MKGSIGAWAERNYPSEAYTKDNALVEHSRKKMEHYLDHGNFDSFDDGFDVRESISEILPCFRHANRCVYLS